ncbi:MAG: hypothetical protein M1820_002550 [Bogoriella megaspora]|nr:MAG: hypothetical protein M1820_002550 [Bogoriella megaspora]
MVCSESLDETQSWVHNTLRDASFQEHQSSKSSVGAGVLRSPMQLAVEDRIQQYGDLSQSYSNRDLTYQEDGINAFSGIMRCFEEKGYHKGFIWGCPIEDLNWALCWRSQSGQQRRREGFPSWAWVGWIGGLFPGLPVEPKNPHQSPVFLQISRVGNDGATHDVFKQTACRHTDIDPFGDVPYIWRYEDDPLVDLEDQPAVQDASLSKEAPIKAGTVGLMIEGATIQIRRKYIRTPTWYDQHGSDRRLKYKLDVPGTECKLDIAIADRELLNLEGQNETEEDSSIGAGDTRLLILARDNCIIDDLHHYLLVLRYNRASGFCERLTTMTLMMPDDKAKVLRALNIKRERLILV